MIDFFYNFQSCLGDLKWYFFFVNLLLVYGSLYQLIHFCYTCLAISLVTHKHHTKYIGRFYLRILEDLMQIFSHCVLLKVMFIFPMIFHLLQQQVSLLLSQFNASTRNCRVLSSKIFSATLMKSPCFKAFDFTSTRGNPYEDMEAF